MEREMIGEALKLDVEVYAQRLRSGRLFEMARQGRLTPHAVASYVANLRLLIERTHTHLCLAAQRSRQLGRPNLAAFFESRAHEEKGHEAWADQDLSQLERVFDTKFAPVRSVAIPALLIYLRETIKNEPLLFLPYMILAEYVTVLLGSEWMTLLEIGVHVPAEALTVVGNHVMLDGEHVFDNLREVDSLVNDEASLLQMRQTLWSSISFLDDFCAEIVALCERHDIYAVA
jgi:hypothetical protein